MFWTLETVIPVIVEGEYLARAEIRKDVDAAQIRNAGPR